MKINFASKFTSRCLSTKLISSNCERRPNYLLFMEILPQDLTLFGQVFYVLNQRLVILVDAREGGSFLAVESFWQGSGLQQSDLLQLHLCIFIRNLSYVSMQCLPLLLVKVGFKPPWDRWKVLYC